MRSDDRIQTIAIRDLNPHEQVLEENLKKVLTSLKVERTLKHPIIVDKDTKVILDGHHRAKACALLGVPEIPCFLIEYHSHEITVEPHRDSDITKGDVIQKGLSDDLFPPKTSKHIIEQRD